MKEQEYLEMKKQYDKRVAINTAIHKYKCRLKEIGNEYEEMVTKPELQFTSPAEYSIRVEMYDRLKEYNKQQIADCEKALTNLDIAGYNQHKCESDGAILDRYESLMHEKEQIERRVELLKEAQSGLRVSCKVQVATSKGSIRTSNSLFSSEEVRTFIHAYQHIIDNEQDKIASIVAEMEEI